MLMEETTASLAMRPERRATAACQVPKPRGAKMKSTVWPTLASRELLLSSTIWNTPSTKPKPWRNQRMTEERRMTVPARLMKDQPRSQVARSTLTAAGAW